MFVDYADLAELPEELDMVRIVVPRVLDDEEVMRAGGCFGYAAKEVSGDNVTSDPYDIVRVNKTTSFSLNLHYLFQYEEVGLVLSKADEYLEYGTPKRTTNRSGPNTKNTRLVQGMGIECQILVEHPEHVTRSVVIMVDGLIAYTGVYEAEVGREDIALADHLSRYAAVLGRPY